MILRGAGKNVMFTSLNNPNPNPRLMPKHDADQFSTLSENAKEVYHPNYSIKILNVILSKVSYCKSYSWEATALRTFRFGKTLA